MSSAVGTSPTQTAACPVIFSISVRALKSSAVTSEAEKPVARIYVIAPAAPQQQTTARAAAKSAGCISCHTASDAPTMHLSPAVRLGCADCHGNDHSAIEKGEQRVSTKTCGKCHRNP